MPETPNGVARKSDLPFLPYGIRLNFLTVNLRGGLNRGMYCKRLARSLDMKNQELRVRVGASR